MSDKINEQEILKKYEWQVQPDGREICVYCRAEKKFGHEFLCKNPAPFVYKTRLINENDFPKERKILEFQSVLTLNNITGNLILEVVLKGKDKRADQKIIFPFLEENPFRIKKDFVGYSLERLKEEFFKVLENDKFGERIIWEK